MLESFYKYPKQHLYTIATLRSLWYTRSDD